MVDFSVCLAFLIAAVVKADMYRSIRSAPSEAYYMPAYESFRHCFRGKPYGYTYSKEGC
jgi:hypothetical protein